MVLYKICLACGLPLKRGCSMCFVCMVLHRFNHLLLITQRLWFDFAVCVWFCIRFSSASAGPHKRVCVDFAWFVWLRIGFAKSVLIYKKLPLRLLLFVTFAIVCFYL